MSWRKSKFSYFMWFLYTLFTVAVLMLSTLTQTGKIFGKIPFGGLIPGFVIIVLSGLAVYLRQWSIERRRNLSQADTFLPGNTEQSSARNRVAWEIVIVLALSVAGLILRLDRMLDGQGELSAYYETAAVVEGQVIPSVAHGADYLYLQVLHLVFLFMGNKFAAAIWLQIILQLLAALMLFAGVRRLAGPAASLVMFGLFMFAGAMIDGAVVLSPQMLYLLLFVIGIDFLAICPKNRLKYPALLGVGIWIGCMGYLDIGGFLLLIFLASCAVGDRNEKMNRRKELTAFCFGLIGTFMGFLGAMGADVSISGKSFGNVLKAWMGLYSPDKFQSSALLNEMNMGWWTVVLSIFMIAGVFSFWYDKEKDRMSMWVLGGCVSVAAGCFGIFTEELPMYLYLFLFVVVLAGLGAGEINYRLPQKESEGMDAQMKGKSQMSKKEKKVKRRKNDKREIEAAAAQEQDIQAPAVETTSETALPMTASTGNPDSSEKRDQEQETEVPDEKRVREQKTAVPDEKRDQEQEMASTDEKQDQEQETAVSDEKNDKEPAASDAESGKESKSPKYIENPLPLPKPHVKKTMDYAKKPSPGEDDFDHPVKDNDDFDI